MDEVSLPRADSPAWQRTLGYLGGAFLGGVLLVAAWAKTLDPSAFAGQITQEGLDFLLPAMAVAIFALGLEVFLGSALVLGIRRLYILGPSAALVVFFLFLTGRSYWRYLQGIEPEEGASCGCFGNLVQRTPAEAFWQDTLLMVPALLLAFLAWRTTARWPVARLAVVSVLTLATVVVAWKAPELPLDDLATRLRPGTDPATLCAGSEENGSLVCLDAILPEIGEGEHLVIIAEVDDETFLAAVDQLNEHHLAGADPPLWVLTASTEEQLFQFRFSRGPAFELRESPPALLRPLYRTLPRSFRTSEGRVVETFQGLPPLED